MIKRIAFLVAALGTPLLAAGNDFPTQARVEFVLQCMQAHGGQTYDNLYACVCSIDKIAAKYEYADFEQVEMLNYLRSTPGERGGVFRDAAPNSRERVNRFVAVREEAEAACFPKQAAQ